MLAYEKVNVIGLFGGGGLLGDIGGFLGTNTDDQKKAVSQASAQEAARLREGQQIIADILPQVQPFLQPVADITPGALQTAQQNATLEGFGQNLGNILNSGALQPLVDERQRAANFALSSAGLSRSSAAAEQAAAIPTELALAIEQTLAGRQGDLLSTGLGGTSSLANLLTNNAASQANILAGIGAIEGDAILGREQLNTAASNNLANLVGGGLSAAGSAELLSGLGGLGSFLGALSDVRLKKDLVPLGDWMGLTLYSWEWIDPVKELDPDNLMTQMTAGFLAQDVREKYPEFTGEFAGFLTIDYESLISRLH